MRDNFNNETLRRFLPYCFPNLSWCNLLIYTTSTPTLRYDLPSSNLTAKNVGILQLHIFRIASRFSMNYSPLAKWIRKRTDDTIRAENLFIVASAAIVIVLMLANQFAWAFIRNEVLAHPRGDVAISYWLTQLAFVSLYLFTSVVGFKPAITITCTNTAVNIQNGDMNISVPYTSIQHVGTVSSMTFHRHYRRFKATLPFINGVADEYVLLRTASHPVVVGLEAEDQRAFMAHIQALRETVSAKTETKAYAMIAA